MNGTCVVENDSRANGSILVKAFTTQTYGSKKKAAKKSTKKAVRKTAKKSTKKAAKKSVKKTAKKATKKAAKRRR